MNLSVELLYGMSLERNKSWITRSAAFGINQCWLESNAVKRPSKYAMQYSTTVASFIQARSDVMLASTNSRDLCGRKNSQPGIFSS